MANEIRKIFENGNKKEAVSAIEVIYTNKNNGLKRVDINSIYTDIPPGTLDEYVASAPTPDILIKMREGGKYDAVKHAGTIRYLLESAGYAVSQPDDGSSLLIRNAELERLIYSLAENKEISRKNPFFEKVLKGGEITFAEREVLKAMEWDLGVKTIEI